jgi:hypothetical protein
MPNLFQRLSSGADTAERASGTLPISFQQWVDSFSFNGSQYPFVVNNGNTPQDNQEIGGDFRGYVDGIYKRSGPVFSCMAVRARLFSEARFQFQRMRAGRPGDLYGTEALKPLESPWTNGTTSQLLKRALLDVDLAGNFYAVRRGEEDPAAPAGLGDDHRRDRLGLADRRGGRRLPVPPRRARVGHGPGGAAPGVRRAFQAARRSDGELPRHVVADAGHRGDPRRQRRDQP